MPILQPRDEDAVRTEFARIAGPVKLVVFSQELVAGDLCRQNEQLIREVAALSDQISVEVLNPAIDKERAQAYGIEEVPATVVEGARDYGVRFLGIPAGYEFSNLIDSIIAVSSGEAALTDDTKASLAALAGDGRVTGELYRLDDPELPPVLDREEGYNFQRSITIVTLAGGRRARAWVYRYCGPRERAVPVPHGDYRRI